MEQSDCDLYLRTNGLCQTPYPRPALAQELLVWNFTVYLAFEVLTFLSRTSAFTRIVPYTGLFRIGMEPAHNLPSGFEVRAEATEQHS